MIALRTCLVLAFWASAIPLILAIVGPAYRMWLTRGSPKPVELIFRDWVTGILAIICWEGAFLTFNYSTTPRWAVAWIVIGLPVVWIIAIYRYPQGDHKEAPKC